MTTEATATRDLPEVVGPYRLLDQIGEGGMGVVYRAIHQDSGERVAIKMVRSLTPRHLAALRDEVIALRRIRHAGVVQVVDEGLSAGLPWYAMELLEGATLADFNQRLWGIDRPVAARTGTTGVPRLEGPPIAEPVPRSSAAERRRSSKSTARMLAAGSLSEVLDLYRCICAALNHIHRRGMVHRDLKPSNVILKTAWGPVLMDFGLAARADGAIGREALASDLGLGRAGTAAYMAPEQIRGEVVDARADLYSLGCMIYETLSGQPPFDTSNRSEVLSAHLANVARPLSEVVAEVPPALDSLLKLLLAKKPQDRLGYAEDVDAVLADLGGRRPPPYSATSERDVHYLYRPRLVGRSDTLERIDHHIQEAANQRGGLLLIGGESGIGKTFLATEVSQRASARGFAVLTGDCLPATNAPFQPVRRLLQFVGDRCRHQGRSLTDRLLGARGKVLAQYEPSLAFAPGQEQLPDPPAMVPAAARERVFDALADTIALLSDEQPLLWILDDMQWADDMTLSFLASRTRRLFTDRRLLILATFRSDEPKEGLSRLLEHPDATAINLSRLDRGSISSLAADMLGMQLAPTFLASFLEQHAEGNPFFVAEYLRVAVSENVLRRQSGRWELESSSSATTISERLSLSQSIQDLIARRLGDLGDETTSVLSAAAVIGREFDVDLLGHVLATFGEKPPRLFDALEILRRRHLLEPSNGSRQRFSHDKIREVAYVRIEHDARKRLHGLVAQALELRTIWSTEQASLYPQLAHHLTHAGQLHRGADHFLRAARRARADFANEDAVHFSRAAIANLEEAIGDLQAPHALKEMLVAANEEMGEVLSLVGSHDAACAAFASGLALCTENDDLCRARLNRRIGKARAGQNRYVQALESYSTGERVLDIASPGVSSLHWREWIEIQQERIWAYYWTGDTSALGRAIEDLALAVERHGTSAQRANFYQARCLTEMRRSRYLVSPTTLALIRGAAQEAASSGTVTEATSVKFILAFALLFFGNLGEARTEMTQVLDAATRLGDPLLRLRALTYLAVILRQLRDVDGTRQLAMEALEIAAAQSAFHYLGAGQANLGWALFSAGLVPDAESLLRAALVSWSKAPTVYPFKDLATWPLLAILVQADRCAEAGDLLPELSDENQRQFSPTLNRLLDQAESSRRARQVPSQRTLEALLDGARSELLF